MSQPDEPVRYRAYGNSFVLAEDYDALRRRCATLDDNRRATEEERDYLTTRCAELERENERLGAAWLESEGITARGLEPSIIGVTRLIAERDRLRALLILAYDQLGDELNDGGLIIAICRAVTHNGQVTAADIAWARGQLK